MTGVLVCTVPAKEGLMGCDILFFVEVFDPAADLWRRAPDPKLPCRFCRGAFLRCEACRLLAGDHADDGTCLYTLGGVYTPGLSSCDWAYCKLGVEERPYYVGRNYKLYGLLAGVRGAKDPDFTKVRGLPKDCSPEVSAAVTDSLSHTPTWYTLQEADSYDWESRGMLQFAQSIDLIKHDYRGKRVRLVMSFDS